MTYHIATARTTDFLAIAALDRCAWPARPDEFIPDGEQVLVARLDDEQPPLAETERIAGAVVMFPTRGGETFLHKIMVHPACRGQGLGSELMQAALVVAPSRLLLTVNPENAPAVRLYEKFGYRVREHVPGYYRPHEHRYVMVYEK